MGCRNDGGLGGEVTVEVPDAHAAGTRKILHGGAVETLLCKGKAHAFEDLDGAMFGLGRNAVWLIHGIRHENERSFTQVETLARTSSPIFNARDPALRTVT